ncbi:MAG: hypothetical protein INF78_12120 [Roseomonas sp.]|nr:hypothetical protein [Roseomonas sp.]
MQPGIMEVPKWMLQALNNLCDIERKLSAGGDPLNARRNIERIKEAFEATHLFYEDPMGQDFNETRIDLEASITGTNTETLKVVEVIKPVIRVGSKTLSRVVQKGIVVVESRPDDAVATGGSSMPHQTNEGK